MRTLATIVMFIQFVYPVFEHSVFIYSSSLSLFLLDCYLLVFRCYGLNMRVIYFCFDDATS